MSFVFERGAADSPRGHALIYFQNSQDSSELLASYMLVLPIKMDVAKYMPPFMMAQLGDMEDSDLSAFAFPPVPEIVGGLEDIQRLAKSREDDIIFGGSITPSDVMSLLGQVSEAVAWYSGLCDERTVQQTPDELAESSAAVDDDDGEDSLSVNDVLYGLMSDRDKLSELTRLVGRLRDAVGSGDDALTEDTRTQIITLGRHLPEAHQVYRLADAACSGGDDAARLTNLYLQRCFLLLSEEYVELGRVEDEIRDVEEASG